MPGPGRYGPPRMVSVAKDLIIGRFPERELCTSHVERNNATIRLFVRRFTRLTYCFSKKLTNLRAAVALHVAYHNLCRRHSAHRITPAMAAGVTDRVWGLGELLQATP